MFASLHQLKYNSHNVSKDPQGGPQRSYCQTEYCCSWSTHAIRQALELLRSGLSVGVGCSFLKVSTLWCR